MAYATQAVLGVGILRTFQASANSVDPGSFIDEPPHCNGEPEDSADVLLFLALHAARFIIGQLLVDNGRLLVGRYRAPTPAPARGRTRYR